MALKEIPPLRFVQGRDEGPEVKLPTPQIVIGSSVGATRWIARSFVLHDVGGRFKTR